MENLFHKNSNRLRQWLITEARQPELLIGNEPLHQHHPHGSTPCCFHHMHNNHTDLDADNKAASLRRRRNGPNDSYQYCNGPSMYFIQS